jgi:hypothetical protein
MIKNKMTSLVLKAKDSSLALAQKIGAAKVAPSNAQIQGALFLFGVTILSLGLAKGGFTQDFGIEIGIGTHDVQYNDSQIAQAVVAILTYIEGAFGALVMVGAGIAAILSSAFGQYRAALGCLVVAVGAFILRSVMSTFFNTQTIDDTAA